VAAAARAPDGLLLVAVQPQRPAGVIGIRLDAEDPAAAPVEDALGDQIIDPGAGLEGGVELDEGIGPEPVPIELGPNGGGDPRVGTRSRAERAGNKGSCEFVNS
jgi:hypothetical protein